MKHLFLPLAPGQVHVLTIQLDASPSELHQCIGILSDEECRRLDGLKFPQLKQSFAVSHAALRLLLAHYLKLTPRDVLLTIRPGGKPELANGSPLRFNMSHSGQLASYAFAFNCELGIDIETIRPLGDWADAIARQFLHPLETSELSSLSVEDRGLSFFRCWTRKEAYIKALGTGFATPLNTFAIPMSPATPFIVESGRRWNLRDLEPGRPGYVSALAHEGAMSLIQASSPFTIADLGN